MPRIGYAEPVSGVVCTPGPDGNEYSPTRTRSDDPIYSVVRIYPGRVAQVAPATRTAHSGSGTIRRLTVLFV